MTATIKAIDTRYAGHLFRSRLEARWAVFFDHLQLRWEYEPEGYELPDGTRYLPDFRLTNPSGSQRWVEVKPAHITSDPKFTSFWLALHPDGVCNDTTDAAMVSGSPLEWLQAGNSICPRCGMPHGTRFANGVTEFLCDPCDWETPCGGGHSPEATGIRGIAWKPHKGWIELDCVEADRFARILLTAAVTAQEARFEHGERPS